MTPVAAVTCQRGSPVRPVQFARSLSQVVRREPRALPPDLDTVGDYASGGSVVARRLLGGWGAAPGVPAPGVVADQPLSTVGEVGPRRWLSDLWRGHGWAAKLSLSTGTLLNPGDDAQDRSGSSIVTQAGRTTFPNCPAVAIPGGDRVVGPARYSSWRRNARIWLRSAR